MELSVKATTQYVATTATSLGVAIFVHALISGLWTSLSLHLPF